MSARQAEFLHHEVPGIIVPDEVRKRMADSPPENAGAIGMEIAREIVSAVGSEFPGVYLITPFLHFDSTCELARFARAM
jgi:methionine synthase / methylenetetrahydrofolate reductase(NADPH)